MLLVMGIVVHVSAAQSTPHSPYKVLLSKRLTTTSSVIHDYLVTNVRHCSQLCLQTEQCLSFNVVSAGQGVNQCEMHNNTNVTMVIYDKTSTFCGEYKMLHYSITVLQCYITMVLKPCARNLGSGLFCFSFVVTKSPPTKDIFSTVWQGNIWLVECTSIW